MICKKWREYCGLDAMSLCVGQAYLRAYDIVCLMPDMRYIAMNGKAPFHAYLTEAYSKKTTESES